MKKEDFKKNFLEAVKDIRKEASKTYYWKLPSNDDKFWAIVVGTTNGGDELDNDVAAKIAYQPAHSLMQEYDIDWTMPYDKDGNVDDTEIFISKDESDDDILKDAEGLFKDAFRVVKEWSD